jgi:coenzyme F420-reducing hydrogenase delta subunit
MNTGVLADIASANYHATGFIPFNYAGLTFKIKTCTGTDTAGLAFYDENDVFISGLKTGNDTSVMTTTSFTVPDRTKKIRFSCIGASNISKVLIALNRTTDIVAAQAKLSEAIYNKIAIAWNTKTYVKSTGVIVAAPNDTFKSSSISVAKNERFKISGKSADAAVLYVLEDKDGNVVEVYPETVNNTYHQDVIINVKNDGVLKIGYYQTETALIKMPVIDADQDNNDYFYNESAYKTLLIRSVLFIGDNLTEGAYYHPDYNGLPISENYPYYSA